MSLPLLTFSSDALNRRDGFGAYHDLYAAGSDVTRVDEAFRAQVRMFRFNRMIVFDRHIDGVLHSRDHQRVRRDGFDHVALHLLVSGDLIAGPHGDERPVRAGEIVLFDTSRPQRSQNRKAHLISASVARDQIAPLVTDISQFHGHILPDETGGLVADMMQSLVRRADTLSPEAAEQSGIALAILLAAALKRQAPSLDPFLEPGRASLARREEAEAYIEAHLADQSLDADDIAAGMGISRSMLYRCFVGDGGVARFIQQRRLERVRDALRRRSETRSIATLAYEHGFASEQHFNRAFRSGFGQPPGRFRATVADLRRRRSVHEDLNLHLSDWLSELF